MQVVMLYAMNGSNRIHGKCAQKKKYAMVISTQDWTDCTLQKHDRYLVCFLWCMQIYSLSQCRKPDKFGTNQSERHSTPVIG